MKAIAVWGLEENGTCRCSNAGCKSPGKHPRGRWRHDPEEPVAGDNVGYPTGPDSGMWVLDVDNKPDRDGLDSLKRLVRQNGGLPRTRIAKTGSGGMHLYFKWPESGTIFNSVDQVGTGLDVRGLGGFVVAPPSKHVSGGDYEWLSEGPVLPAPAWLLELVLGESEEWAAVSQDDANGALKTMTPAERLKRAIEYARAMGPAIEGEGGDAHTFRVAHVGFSFGVNQSDWEKWMLSHWNKECRPQWDKKDLQKKVRNGYSYPVGATFGWRLVDQMAEPFRLGLGEDSAGAGEFFVLSGTSDASMAQGFLDHAPQQFVVVDKTVYMYDRFEWNSVEPHDLARMVSKAMHGKDADIGGSFQKISLDYRKVMAIANYISLLVEQKHPSWIQDIRLRGSLSTSDGVVEVTHDGSIKVHPHSPDLAGSQHLDIKLQGKTNRPEKWLKFLRESLSGDDVEDKIKLVQEFMGAAMTGLATSYDKALVLYGRGSNGKSTFLKACEKLLFRQELVTSLTPEALTREFSLIKLQDKLINAAGELPSRVIRDSDIFKGCVSGDTQTARHLRQSLTSFTPRAAHIFAANELPSVSDSSKGFWRRCELLVFEGEFEGLVSRHDLLNSFSEERVGIIKWALEGACRLRKNKRYTQPSSSVSEGEEWMDDADPIHSFLKDVIASDAVEGEDNFISTSSLYREFLSWFDSHSGGKSTRYHLNGFSRKLKTLGFKKSRTAKARGYYLTVRPRSEWEVNV